MTAHTPGPWRVSDTDWVQGYRIQAVVSAVDGDDIAQVTNVPDARLIAVAPEMLEALKIITYWYNKANRDGVVLAQGIDKARAAIAKAKGGK